MSKWKPEYTCVRTYTGQVKAVILDWSGTAADKYVLAPLAAFVQVFKMYKVDVSMAEARIPMGIRKDLHIKAILEMDGVRKRWHEAHGEYPTQKDVDAMYKDFVPAQLEVLKDARYSRLLPGTAQGVRILKEKYKIKIGTSTGFVSSMSDMLADEASKQGYTPDCRVAGDSVQHGSRPNPHMIYKNMDILDVSAIQSVIKVDDCVSGLHEAHSAGCWAVGVARYGNYMEIDSFEQEMSVSEAEIQTRLTKAKNILAEGGAHYVIDTLADLPDVVEDINARLARGEKP